VVGAESEAPAQRPPRRAGRLVCAVRAG